MDKTKSAIWRMRGKRALSVLLSTALVVSMGTGISFVSKTAPKAEAAETGNKQFITTEPSGSYYKPTDIQQAKDGTWSSGIYVVRSSQTVSNVKISGTVFLEIEDGVTLTCKGSNASGSNTPGKPGIELTSGSTLIVLGEGILVANGGNAANGSAGSAGSSPKADGNNNNEYVHSGAGGSGGAGGAGAGAGIGTAGGTGGSGGSGGGSVSRKNDHHNDGRTTGSRGGSGSSGGSVSTGMGNLYVLGSVKVTAKGGSAGYGGAGGSFDSSNTVHVKRDQGIWYKDRHGYSVAGAGGGGGAGGSAGAGIGIGGAGGGGGGGGASAGVYVNDTKDNWTSWSTLYGGGGAGGKGARNGNNGSGSKGTYGGSGGSGAYGGSSTGSTTTVQKNNLASISATGNGGKDAIISTKTKLSYNQSVVIEMQDERSGVNKVSGSDNIYNYANHPTTYAEVKPGYSSFEYITDVTDKQIYKPGYTFLGWYSGTGDDAKCVIDADGNVVQDVTNYTCQGVYNSVANPLYAHWKRNTYKLTFDANGGGFSGNRKQVPKNSYTGESLEDLTGDQSPTRTGYFLLGYNTKKDGTGDWIYGAEKKTTKGEDGNESVNIIKDKGQNVKVFWQTILEEKASESDEHLPDDKVVKQKNTSASTFLNTWNTTDTSMSADASKAKLDTYLKSSLEGIYPYEEDTTVYAQWAPVHYTLRYFSEDSTGEAQWLGDEYNVPYFNVVYKELSDFDVTRKHYDFKGWNIYASQDWGMYQPKKNYRTGLTEKDEDIVSLYAAWQMTDSYTITYNGNGGAGTPANGYTFKDSKESDDDTYVISSKKPTRENYSFMGWNTEIDGSGKEWKAGQKVPGNVGGNLTLYAQWKLNPSVTYHANGGSFSVTPEKQHIAVGENFKTLSGDELPSREGYDFKGWSTSPNEENATVYSAGEEITMPEAAFVLYAVWEKKGYGVTAEVYNDDPDNVTEIPEYYTLQIEENPDADSDAKYINFARKVTNGTGDKENTQMSIEYTAKKSDDNDFKVKYKEDFTFRVKVPNYVDTSDMVVYANGAVLISKRKSKDDDCTYYYYTVTNASAAQELNITGLKYRTYDISFNTNGGEIEADKNISQYSYGTETTLPEPVKTGYTFKGWYTDKNFNSAKVEKIGENEKGDKTFYAKWEANKYSIVFDGTVYEEKTTSDGENTTTTYEETNRGGITSEKQRTYTISDYVYDSSTPLEMHKFKYHTDVTKYTGDGGNDYDDYTDDKAGEKVKFLGWSTKKGAESPDYLDGMRVFNLCTGAGGNNTVTLYAVWKVENSKITYNGNGGKIERTVESIEKDDNGKVKTDENGTPIISSVKKKVSSYTEEKQTCTDVTLNFDDVTKEGYTFLGWTTKLVDDDGQPVTKPEYYTSTTYNDGKSGSNETLKAADFESDVVLYAVWKENSYTVTFDGNGASTHQVQKDESGQPAEGTLKQSTVGYSFTDAVTTGQGKVYRKKTIMLGNSVEYYIRVESNGLYYKLSSWKDYTHSSKIVSLISGSNDSDVTADNVEPVYAYRTVYDTDSNNYPIFKYKDSDDKIHYLCAKEDVGENDKASLYEVKKLGANSDSISVNNESVATEAFTDGTKTTFADFKANLSFIYDYQVYDSSPIDHTGHEIAADSDILKQEITYSESAYLGLDANGDKKFDVNEGGITKDAFEKETRTDAGLVGLTGFYKTQTDGTKMAYFLGWSRKKDATEPDYLQNERVEKLATGATGDDSVTLYAVWSDSPVSYAMFNANGGKFTSKTDDSTAAYGTIRDKVTGNHIVQSSLMGENGTVTVKAKDGSTADDGSEFTLTKPGYEFKGWATRPKLIGDELKANIDATMKKLKAELASDYSSETYYAIWEPKSVTVTFNGNGGTYSEGDDAKDSYTQAVEYEKSAKLDKNKFTRTGYHFVRWAVDVYDGTAVNDLGYNDEDNIFLSSEDEANYKNGLTLYAIWEENPSHKLIYDANGGYGGPGMQDFVEGVEGKIYISEQFEEKTETSEDGQTVKSEEETVSMPKRDGYTFLGWSEKQDASAPDEGYAYVESKSVVESNAVKYPTWTSKDGDSDKTLYAVWDKIPENDVNYLTDNNDSAAAFKTKTYKKGDTFSLYFDRTPAKEGYEFVGWTDQKDLSSDDADYADHIYKSGDEKSYTMPGNEVTFYPVWEAHKYKVIYKTPNDETAEVTDGEVAYDKEFAIPELDEITKKDGLSEDVAKSFEPKSGYKFKGWSMVSGGKTDYQAGDKVSRLSSVDGTEITLYAVYEPVQSVYTFVNKYKVSSFDEYADSTTEDKTLDPVTVGEPMTVLSEIPVKFGYTFGGYFTEKNGEGEMYYTKDLTTTSEHALNDNANDTTLYAYWIPNEYTIYYEYDGQQVASQDVHYGQETTTLAQEDITGLTLDEDTVLVGWALDKESDEVDFKAAGDSVKMLEQVKLYKDGGNIIFYAITGKSTKSTVTYNPNGGTNEPVDGTKYKTGDVVEVNFAKQPKRTGYTFLGWAKTSSAEKPVYYQTDDETDLNAKTSFAITTDTTLYAVWKANSYSITYHKNYLESDKNSGVSASGVDESGSQVKDTLGYEEDDYKFKGADTFERKGYTLSGWAITSETGVTYTLGQKIPSALTGVDGGNVDLYAVWTANSYIVGYDANQPENVNAEVKGNMKDTSMTYDTDGTLRANSYKLAGYKFMGWSTTPAGAVEYKDSAEVKNLCESGRIVLYAVWKNRADLTDDELDDIDWSEKTMVAIMSNTYAVTVNAGEKPNIDNLIITAVYSDGACRVVKGYTTNIDSLDTNDDTDIVVSYTENNITKTIKIPVRIKNKKAAEPTTAPTVEPTVEPTVAPTVEPTTGPTIEPTTKPASNSAIKGTNKRIYLTSKVSGKKKDRVQVSWKKLTGATKYTVYGNINGKKAVVIKNIKYNKKTKTYKYTITKIAKKKLSKKKNYFFYVIGYKYVNGQRVRVGRSYTTYVTMKKTKKGYGNVKTVSFRKNKKIKYNKKKKQSILTLKLNKKKNKVFTIKTKLKYVSGKKQIKKPALLYYTSNKKIATVNKKGKITAKKKGKCSIYVVARNGVYKVLTVNVKKK